MKLWSLAILLFSCLVHVQSASKRRCPRTNSQPYRYCTNACNPSSSACAKQESCRCDGDCGYSCVPNGINCGKTRSIRHGKVQNNSTRFGGIAVYSCRNPYTLTGTKRQRCSAITKWTGKQARCKIICRDPGDVTSGIKYGTQFREGKKVRYSCYPGLTLEGQNILTCTKKGTWDAPKPTCKAPTCAAPAVPSNMRIFNPPRLPSRFRFMARVGYLCLPGYYRLQGNSYRLCNTSGWSKLTLVCRPKTCGDPKTPVNGIQTGYQYTFKKKVYYSCKDGYKLVGSRYRQCQANQVWSGKLPRCEVVDCGSLPAPTDGRKISETKTTYQGEVVFECQKTGHEMNGPKVRHCRTDGKWSGSTTTCEAVSCDDPGEPVNGKQEVVTKNYRYTGSVTFICETNYTLIGKQQIFCGHDKSWSGPVPQCAGPCRDPGIPENGTRTGALNHFSHDQVVTFRCNRFHELKGAKEIKCQSGQWSSATPQCEVVKCGDPGVPKHGKQVQVLKSYSFGASVNFACDAHYRLIGDKNITCREDTSWSGDLPKCTNLCADPGQPKNGIRMDHDFTFGKIVRFRCNANSLRKGPRAIQCRNGTWDGDVPQCLGCTAELKHIRRVELSDGITLDLQVSKLITGLKLEKNAEKCQVYLKFRTAQGVNGWSFYKEEGEDKYFQVISGTPKVVAFKAPFMTRSLQLKCKGGKKGPNLKSVTLVGCEDSNGGFSDCILAGSKVWLNTLANEQRTVYEEKPVKKIQVGTAKIYSRKGWVKDFIPNIIPSKNMLMPGTRVIAKDHGTFYGGTIHGEVRGKDSQWEIKSHDVKWISHLKDIRIIEKPDYC